MLNMQRLLARRSIRREILLGSDKLLAAILPSKSDLIQIGNLFQTFALFFEIILIERVP